MKALSPETLPGSSNTLGCGASYGLARAEDGAACSADLRDWRRAARRLEAVALARYAVNKSVIRLRRNQLGALPRALAETLPHLPGLKGEGSFAVVCSGKGCLPPVSTVDELIEAMNKSL